MAHAHKHHGAEKIVKSEVPHASAEMNVTPLIDVLLVLLTAEDMKRGIPMAENMAESKLFPKMLVNMIEVGAAEVDEAHLKLLNKYFRGKARRANG